MTTSSSCAGIAENRYQNYLAALLRGDRAGCAAIVQELVAAEVGLKTLYQEIFQRAMYEVGELWEQQQISVAVEHLATAITERMLTLVQPRAFGGSARAHAIIVACVGEEFHQLGGRMIADFCELQGWRGIFLGANASLVELLKVTAERRPTVVGLSMSLYSSLPALRQTLDAILAQHPEQPILVGGQAFRWGGVQALQPYRTVTYVASLDDLEVQLQRHE